MTEPAMDANAFAEMKEIMGEAFMDVISMCLQSLTEQLKEIEAAIENQNAEALFNVSHKMKSSCGSIGAFGLAARAEAVELIGRNGSTDVSAQIYDDLHRAAQQVITILDTELNGERAS